MVTEKKKKKKITHTHARTHARTHVHRHACTHARTNAHTQSNYGNVNLTHTASSASARHTIKPSTIMPR